MTEKANPLWRSQVLTSLLRKQSSIEKPTTPLKLTKEYIESKRHTRVQLAEWGITWPPPKGWKKRLIKG